MNIPGRHPRGLIYFLIAAFCHFLIQPQIGMFAHTHASDAVPHRHPYRSHQQSTPHHHTHEQTSHTHTPHIQHPHSHRTDTHHTHDHVHTPRVKPKPVSGPSLRRASSSRHHWHTTIMLHLSGLSVAFVWPASLAQRIHLATVQTQIHWTSPTIYQPRAPPLLG